jgi:nicotinate-nucleotide adenylyltransferase
MPSNFSLGILGGTFDPIHLGHLHLASVVKEKIGLNEVRFLPNFQPLLREQPLANAQHRFAMVELALADYKDFHADNTEILREGFSYTFDTLVEIRKKYPQHSLSFIMAADQFVQFHHWHRWQEITELCHLIIATRKGYSMTLSPELEQFTKLHATESVTDLQNKLHGAIYFIDIEPLAISATAIRQHIKAGIYPEQALPKSVWEYIRQHQLYKN